MSLVLVCVNIPLVGKILPFLLIIILFGGCSSSQKAVIPDALSAAPVITGSVINADAFKKGGMLALGSFKPGPGAAADDETDQLSAMMIKGIKDALPASGTPFTILPSDQSNSDLFLEGYIEDYGSKGRSAHLSVDGEIWLRETGEKILMFQTTVVFNLKNQDPKTVAYQIGCAIANFMGGHS